MTKKKNELENEQEESKTFPVRPTVIRRGKMKNIIQKTGIRRNTTIIGDSLEIMIEKIKEGEGEDSIEDRDLVYNDNETETVNPLTNIRSDKMELMLEESIDEINFRHRKAPTKEVEEGDGDGEGGDGEN